MATSRRTARSALLLLAGVFYASAFPIRDGPSVFAPDAAQSLQKRAIMKGDNYVPLGNTTIPLTPVLLVLCGLGAAALGLAIALLRILVPSCMSRSSRIVLQERERAFQDLRVRGSPRGSPGGSPTPGSSTPVIPQRRFQPNKIPRKVGRNSRGSFTPNSEISSTGKRVSHGYRGTSFSLADARKNSDKSHKSSLSGLAQLPLLGSSDSSSGSSTLLVNARDAGMVERGGYPITAATDAAAAGGGGRPRLSFGANRLNRNSSVGKGADLQRTRSGRGRPNNEITLNPQPVDPAYANKWGRSISYSHPLQSSAHRRDSSYSLYEVSSSGEHSVADSKATSRISSLINASGSPLQPLAMAGFGSSAQPWASPTTTSRTPSPEFIAVEDPTRLGVLNSAVGGSRSSLNMGLLDSDGSEHGAAAPQMEVLVPSRKASMTR